MFAVVGVGTGIGPILARRFTGDDERLQRLGLAAAYAFTALGLAVMAPLGRFGIFLIGTVLRGVGGGTGWVFSTQLLLVSVSDRVRGRVFATEFMIYTLLYSVGATTGGWLLEETSLGISTLLWGMAALILVPGALWALWIATGTRASAAPLPDEAAQ
jgi:hypothetical protein